MSYQEQGRNLPMMHAGREVKDKEMLKAIIDLCDVCSIAFFDEIYPYVVPVNFGYRWDADPLTIYIHGAQDGGHKRELIKSNPNVCVQMHAFLDRNGYAAYRRENHDYRSVTVFGKIEEVTDMEERVQGMNLIHLHNKRKARFRTISGNLCVWRIRAEEITGKAQYPIKSLEEVPMPPLEPKT